MIIQQIVPSPNCVRQTGLISFKQVDHMPSLLLQALPTVGLLTKEKDCTQSALTFVCPVHSTFPATITPHR